MSLKRFVLLLLLIAQGNGNAFSREYHVPLNGSDDGDGSLQHPLKTISAASKVARAGDTVTLHKGTYREWVDPPFGGTSNLDRITYRAAPGEKVIIKGSEVIQGWEKVKDGVWKVTLDNTFFGDYNPYQEIVRGDWFLDFGRPHHTGEVYLNGKSLFEIDSLKKVFNAAPLPGAQDKAASIYHWYCESNSRTTAIWANFHGFDPNKELVEINVRPAVFFPRKTGINYITVSGFRLSQAATNWAPPTAEQTGLIGPNWCKGWIIENNTISDSKCSGISLGNNRGTRQNYSNADMFKNGHISQLETVFTALKNGWSEETVGSHVIRNNVIFNCEQTGICGNLGAIFSQITDNHIYNIYEKRQWGGFEMGGIKLHAPIDVLIADNFIHHAFKGIWIDWQAQGIKIARNLLKDNSWMDLHLEVSHGPHIIDNNCFLSDLNLWNMTTGSSFINNLFTGQICRGTENVRFTSYHYPHSTKIAGIMTSQGGDDQYINNIFIKTSAPPYDIFEKVGRPKRAKGSMDFGLGMYNDYPAAIHTPGSVISEMSEVKLPFRAKNNLYLNGAAPYKKGVNEVVDKTSDMEFRVEERADGVHLHLTTNNEMASLKSKMVNSLDLGQTMVTEAAFEKRDGTPILFDTDFFRRKRQPKTIAPGPFANFNQGRKEIKLWPK